MPTKSPDAGLFRVNLALSEKTTRRLLPLLPVDATFADLKAGLAILDAEDALAPILGPVDQDIAEAGGYNVFSSAGAGGRWGYRFMRPDHSASAVLYTNRTMAWAGAVADGKANKK